MREELITYETAKLVKEKGFNWECYAKWDYMGAFISNRLKDFVVAPNNSVTAKVLFTIDDCRNDYLAPTQSLLQRWLREEHNIIIVALPYTVSVKISMHSYIWMIYKISASTKKYQPFSTYEEALEQGLLKALKLIEI
jgi:hypothetical protein